MRPALPRFHCREQWHPKMPVRALPVQFAPNQGNSSLRLSGKQRDYGRLSFFGSGWFDLLIVDALTSTSGCWAAVSIDGGPWAIQRFLQWIFLLSNILSFDYHRCSDIYVLWYHKWPACSQEHSKTFFHLDLWPMMALSPPPTNSASQLNPVPLPAALPLFAFGLLDSMVVRRPFLGSGIF